MSTSDKVERSSILTSYQLELDEAARLHVAELLLSQYTAEAGRAIITKLNHFSPHQQLLTIEQVTSLITQAEELTLPNGEKIGSVFSAHQTSLRLLVIEGISQLLLEELASQQEILEVQLQTLATITSELNIDTSPAQHQLLRRFIQNHVVLSQLPEAESASGNTLILPWVQQLAGEAVSDEVIYPALLSHRPNIANAIKQRLTGNIKVIQTAQGLTHISEYFLHEAAARLNTNDRAFLATILTLLTTDSLAYVVGLLQESHHQ